MKKIIIPTFFICLFILSYIVSVTIINISCNGDFIYTSGKKDLSDKEIYEYSPQFVNYDKVYKKYVLKQQYYKGIFYPIIKSDTIWDNHIYAENYP